MPVDPPRQRGVARFVHNRGYVIIGTAVQCWATVKEDPMTVKRKVMAVVVAAVLTIMTAMPALASEPPGLRGYEGQPGHQAGQHEGNHAPGLRGYEGQPGNQGG